MKALSFSLSEEDLLRRRQGARHLHRRDVFVARLMIVPAAHQWLWGQSAVTFHLLTYLCLLYLIVFPEAASRAIVQFLEVNQSEETSRGWMLLTTINLLASSGQVGDVLPHSAFFLTSPPQQQTCLPPLERIAPYMLALIQNILNCSLPCNKTKKEQGGAQLSQPGWFAACSVVCRKIVSNVYDQRDKRRLFVLSTQPQVDAAPRGQLS